MYKVGKVLVFILSVTICCLDVNGQSGLDSLLVKNNTYLISDSTKSILLADIAIHYLRKNADSALIFGEQALVIAEEINNMYCKAVSHNVKGVSFYYKENDEKAMAEYLEAKELADHLTDDHLKTKILENIGIIQIERKDWSSAENTFLHTLKLHETNKDSLDIGKALLHLGSGAYAVNQVDKSLNYTLRAYNVFKAISSYLGIGIAASNIAELYLLKNDFQRAISFYKEAENVQLKENDNAGLAVTYNGIGSTLLKMNKNQEAINYLIRGLELAKNHSELYGLHTHYASLAEAYKTLDPIKAYEYLKLYADQKDTLANQKYSKDLSEINAKYETAKKDNLLKEQQAILYRQNIWVNSLMVTLIILTLLGYLMYNRYRLKKKAELDAAIIVEQKLSLEAVIAAQEEERKRISKDLHDGVAQELVALKLGFHLLEHQIKNNIPIAPDKINTLSKQLEETTTEVRNIAHLMLPPTLEKQGLVPTLELLLSNTLKNAGVEYKINIDGIPESLNQKIELGIYRIAQEIINNIIKHSQARHVIFYLTIAGNTLTLKIQDDGTGYNEQTIKEKSSMGLLNIVSRVATLGGTYKFENIEPHGTNSIVIIPVNSPYPS